MHRSHPFQSIAIVTMLSFGLWAGPGLGGESKPATPPLEEMVENPQPGVAPYRRDVEREGIAVKVAVDHVNPVNKTPGFFTEGDPIRIRFHISETAGGAPLRNAYPAAWLDLNPPNVARSADDCQGKLKSFLGGSLFGSAEINLNEYYVITLNEDATLTVVDPLFGFGGSKLLALIQLAAPGGDWVLSEDQARLFVSQPTADQVALVDTAAWRIRRQLKTGPNPVSVQLQPDQRYLWVAFEGRGLEPGGVNVFHPGTLEQVARIDAVAGGQTLTFDDQSRFAYLTHRANGVTTVIDTQSFKRIAEVKTGQEPLSCSWSALARALYVAHGDGTVAVIDGEAHELSAQIKLDAGLAQLRFEPKGRFAFVVNPQTDTLHIIDAVVQRAVQSAVLLDQPNQINFSDNLGYIRHAGAEAVLMVPLIEIGKEGKSIPVIDFPGGQSPAGWVKTATPAAGIVQAPGANAVLIANARDECIYYFKEGMAAPMGQFQNYGHQPRAVLVVDRSLKEHREPGVYETFATLEKPGLYDLVLFMDSPRLAECFALEVHPHPAARLAKDVSLSSVTFHQKQRVFAVGEPITFDFSIRDQKTGKPRPALDDVLVLVNLQPGVWHHRYAAQAMGDGVYRIQFKPPRGGIYQIIASSPSANLSLQNQDYFVMRAGPPPKLGQQPKSKQDQGEESP